MKLTTLLALFSVLFLFSCQSNSSKKTPTITPEKAVASEPVQWVTYKAKNNPTGKNIVLVTGDEEYRSEEAMPQLAKILTNHHGFNCTVL